DVALRAVVFEIRPLGPAWSRHRSTPSANHGRLALHGLVVVRASSADGCTSLIYTYSH
ncbi:hypothetical protein A2U01_0011261, partial [Trifolium medium]|nr:hypothetical protein [Trifolium medium]